MSSPFGNPATQENEWNGDLSQVESSFALPDDEYLAKCVGLEKQVSVINEKQLDLYSKLLEVAIRSANEGILPLEFVKTTLQNEQVGYAIVVLQRGWVAVGETHLTNEDCYINNAKIIRIWGTKKGLGELALNGPTKDTVLDESGCIRFHRLAVVLTMDTEISKWN